MTTPTTVDTPAGRLDYTSPPSILAFAGTVLTIIDQIFHSDLHLSPWLTSASYALAALGAVGWIAEAIVKKHPKSIGQAVVDVEQVLPMVKQAIADVLAARAATPTAQVTANPTPPAVLVKKTPGKQPVKTVAP